MSNRGRDLAESIRHRLRNRVRERGEDVQYALQRYAAERFLYRLGESAYRNRYVLKGAMLFELWGSSVYRPTRDLDFAGYGSSESEDTLASIRAICKMTAGADGLVFDDTTLSATPIRDESEYKGIRIQFQASLGSSRIPMQIDIGFGNAVEPPAVDVEYPTLLGDPPPRIRAYRREAVVAEKLHAMVVLSERNSRYKDFYDLYLLAMNFTFDGRPLTKSVAATFERRSTEIGVALPVALTLRFFADGARAKQWGAFLTRKSLPNAPADFTAVGGLLQTFLVPVWNALAAKRVFADTWPPAGPWRPEGPRQGPLLGPEAIS